MSVVDVGLPALLAGIAAVLITLAIERLGGRVGGLLGTLPSTIVPASWGLWSASTGDGFRLAMLGVPAGMVLNAGFLWCWREFPPRLPASRPARRLALTMTLSLVGWSAAAALLALAMRQRADDVAERAWVGGSALFVLVGVGLLASRRTKLAPKGTRRVGMGTLLARGGGAAIAAGVAVVVARVGHPLLAGLASVFPAIFLTTMVSLWLAQGEAVPTGAGGPMMLGSSSVAVYALLAAALFGPLGPVLGTVVSWAGAALLATLPASWWLLRRR